MGRYLQLLSQNTLLFNLDYVKTILNEAYKLDSEEKMTIYIDEIISFFNIEGSNDDNEGSDIVKNFK